MAAECAASGHLAVAVCPAGSPSAGSAPARPAGSACGTGKARWAALCQLARMLGIHITVAVAWQRASAGDWAAYAAEVSRRTPAG